MLNDAAKVQKVKYSQNDLRSIWCVGIHAAKRPDEIENMVIKLAEYHGIGLSNDLIHSTEIGKTGFSFTIL